MSTAILAFIAVILCILFRILNVNSQPQKPGIYCKDGKFLDTVLKIAPLLHEPYIPTRLWGFSGHVQTIIHSIIGRVRCPWPIGERCFLHLKDGTTLTYDLYQPLDTSYEDDFTLAICPGIGNTSESVYIRTFVHYAQCHGYRCAVLNHVGALSSVKVTGTRVFTYGHTGDYGEMLSNIVERHPNTQIVCIGFSLGGNLVTKFMGEQDRRRPSNIVGAISICQGYCAIEGTKWLLNWQNFRRFYLYVITESMKSIIMKHRYALLTPEMKQRCGLQEREIIAAATLPELDDAYTRKVHHFKSVHEMYKWSSCVNYLQYIKNPIIFINSKDDPLVPEKLLNPIRNFASTHDKAIYLELSHGGHLGFYEGGLVYPNPVTWLDRTLVALVGSLALTHAASKGKMNKKPLSATINTLDKDIANCEYYLNKVLNSRYGSNPKPPTLRPNQSIKVGLNDIKPRPGIKPISTIKINHPSNELDKRNPPKPQSVISSPNRSESSKGQKRVIHKEVFNNAATVEVTVKTKKPELILKCPRIKNTPTTDIEIDKEFDEMNDNDKNKCMHKQSEKKQKEATNRQKNPSWGQLLQAYKFQELHQNCKKSSNCGCHNHNNHNSIDRELETNKVPTIETLSSRSKSDEGNVLGTFSMFDPLRTVNFLFHELSSKLNTNPKGDSETNKILINIEHTLNRLYANHNIDLQERKIITNNFPVNFLNDPMPSPLKIPDDDHDICDIMDDKPVHMLPERKPLKTMTTQTSRYDLETKENVRNALETDTANLVVQRLQDSCEKLEGTCNEMKETCEELKQEKAALKEELEIRNQQLEATKFKEKEYSKILETFKQNFNNMAKKSEEYLKTISKLTIENNKLHEDIKSLDDLQTTNTQLNLRIHELELMNEKLDTELQIYKLEKEKYNFILERKDSEISRFKGDIGDINAVLKSHLSEIENLKYDDFISDDGPNNNSRLSSNVSENKGLIICSSPTGSHNSPEFYESWHVLSKISPETGSDHHLVKNKNIENVEENVNKRFSTIHEVDSEIHTSFENPNWEGSNNSEYNQSIVPSPQPQSVASNKSCEGFKTLLEVEDNIDNNHTLSEIGDSLSWRTHASNYDIHESATNRLKNGLEDLLAQFSEKLQEVTENVVHKV